MTVAVLPSFRLDNPRKSFYMRIENFVQKILQDCTMRIVSKKL